MFKRFCAAVLAILLIFSGGYAGQDFISAVSMTAQAEDADVWDGTYDTSWYNKEEKEFHISTAAELAGLAQIVNDEKSKDKKKLEGQTIYLDKDITLNDISDYKNWKEKAPAYKWASIGTEKPSFAGTFDAQNHTITGLYVENGLFYSSTGTIKNLNLVSAYATKSTLCYENSGTIENCHVDGVVYTSSNAIDIGGICYLNSGTICNCTMSGTVESGSSAGGICYLNSGTITGCKNTASVTGDASNGFAGGIVGYFKDTDASINNCDNAGKITGNYAGGILGYISSHAYTKITTTIDNSRNTGAVTGTQYAGGILGYVSSSSSSSSHLKTIISNSYNTGTVTGITYVGGILGSAYSYNSSLTASITNVYNTGKLSGSQIGGIIGKNEQKNSGILSITLTSCCYLDTTAVKGIGSETKDNAFSMTHEEMQSEDFVDLLGKAFVYVENSYPKLTWESSAIDEILLGDATLDGEVDILDVITINKAVLGKETLTDEQITSADINKNDIPDSTDALMILKYIVKIIDSLN